MANSEPIEIITLENWIEKEIGPDWVKKIRGNKYIYYGQTKDMLDFLFNNYNTEKYGRKRLVKLNLEIDNERTKSQSIEHKNKNDELSQLEARNKELTRKINQIKRENQDLENNTNSYFKQIFESNNNAHKNDFINKQMDLIIQEKLLEKAKSIKTKLEIATQNVANSSGDSTLNHKYDTNEHERMFLNFINSYPNPSEINNFKDQKKIFLNTNLKSYLAFLNTKLNEDIKKLNQLTDKSHIINEILLLMYQQSNDNYSNEIKKLQRSENGLKDSFVSEAVLDLCMKSTERQCEIKKFKEDKVKIEMEINEAKLKLNQVVKSKYNGPVRSVYARYFRSILLLEKFQSQIDQAKIWTEKLKKEVNNLNSISIDDKHKRLVELQDMIHDRQIKLEDLVEQINESMKKKLQITIRKLNAGQDSLLDTMRSFNSNYSSNQNLNDLSTTICNITNTTKHSSFNGNTSNNNTKIFTLVEQFKPKYQENLEAKDITDIETKYLVDKFIDNNRFTSQSYILQIFIDQYYQMIKELKLINLNNLNTGSDWSMLEQAANELKQYMSKNIEMDTNTFRHYNPKVEMRYNELHNQKRNLIKLENLVNIWWSQPGANDYILPTITSNAKCLDYFLKILDESIARRVNK